MRHDYEKLMHPKPYSQLNTTSRENCSGMVLNNCSNKQIELIENAKKSDLYKTMLDSFTDAELIDVKLIQKDDKND